MRELGCPEDKIVIRRVPFRADFCDEIGSEPARALVLLTPILQTESAVEVRVVPQPVRDVLLVPVVGVEDLGIGREADERAVLLVRGHGEAGR